MVRIAGCQDMSVVQCDGQNCWMSGADDRIEWLPFCSCHLYYSVLHITPGIEF